MAPGEDFGWKNGEPVMAGVLGGDYKARQLTKTHATAPSSSPSPDLSFIFR